MNQFNKHLLLISTLEIPPLLNRPSKVNGVHGQLYLSNDIMFRKSVIVINRHHQGLSTKLLIGYLTKKHNVTYRLYLSVSQDK